MIIHVKVRTNSSKQEIEKFGDGRYFVNLKSEPENQKIPHKSSEFLGDRKCEFDEHFRHNKANVELINMLSKYFCVPALHIKIKSGLTSREKILEIE